MLNVFYESGVPEEFIESLMSGLKAFQNMLGYQFEILTKGDWRHRNWKDKENMLWPFFSLEWFLKKSRVQKSRKVSVIIAEDLTKLLWACPGKLDEASWELVILENDLKESLGSHMHDHVCVLSVDRLIRDQKLSAVLTLQCFETLLFHHFGAMFGAKQHTAPKTEDVCVMRPMNSVEQCKIICDQTRHSALSFCKTCMDSMLHYCETVFRDKVIDWKEDNQNRTKFYFENPNHGKERGAVTKI